MVQTIAHCQKMRPLHCIPGCGRRRGENAKQSAVDKAALTSNRNMIKSCGKLPLCCIFVAVPLNFGQQIARAQREEMRREDLEFDTWSLFFPTDNMPAHKCIKVQHQRPSTLRVNTLIQFHRDSPVGSHPAACCPTRSAPTCAYDRRSNRAQDASAARDIPKQTPR